MLKALGSRGFATVCEEPSPYGDSGKMTREDFAKLPAETGYILQLIDGMLIREPTPTYRHQRISRRLQQILISYFDKIDRRVRYLTRLWMSTLMNILWCSRTCSFYPAHNQNKAGPVDSLPSLVVEILSPSTARTDRIKKLNSYQKAGVTHYWIVDLMDCLIECYKLEGDYYVAFVRTAEGMFVHPDFPDLTFDLQALFADA